MKRFGLLGNGIVVHRVMSLLRHLVGEIRMR